MSKSTTTIAIEHRAQEAVQATRLLDIPTMQVFHGKINGIVGYWMSLATGATLLDNSETPSYAKGYYLDSRTQQGFTVVYDYKPVQRTDIHIYP